MSHNGPLLVTLLGGIALALAAGAEARDARTLRPGDRVEVVSGPAPIKNGDRTLAMVDVGTRLIVVEVLTDWVKVEYRSRGQVVAGWIDAKRVRRLGTEPGPSRAAARAPSTATPSEGTAPAGGWAKMSGEELLTRLAVLVAFAVVIAVLAFAGVRSIGTGAQARPSGREEARRAVDAAARPPRR